jgi:predicted nuclease of predicted toxin-antitoxin system
MAITITESIRDIRCRTHVKFLIDECLSPELVRLAHERAHGESTYVTWLGLRSRKDWTIVRRAVDDGYVLVTNNATDFTPLLSRESVHAGLVCLNVAPGLMSLNVQKRLFALALDRLGDVEPINELLEVTLQKDRSVRIERYDLPSGK